MTAETSQDAVSASRIERLTHAQANMLRNARDGRPLCAGLHGRSAHGGATWTIQSLRKRGLLIPGGGISDAGRAALDAFNAKHNTGEQP